MKCERRRIITLIGFLVFAAMTVCGVDLGPTLNRAMRKTTEFEHLAKLQTFDNDNEHNLRTETNRKLLAPSTNNVCIWNDYNRSCVWDPRRIAQLLFSSRDKFIRYLANYPFCNALKTENSCVVKKQCYWNKWTNQCIFGDLKFGHTHSPCVKSAPAAFVNYEANVVCPKQRSLSACKATRNCIWGNGFCNADYVKIYFGIDSNTFFKEADKVADAQIVELADVMDAKFNVEVSNFDWSRLLRWNAPDMSCPKRATPKVCKYSNAGTKVYLPVSAYCYGKYRSISSCNSDPLCSYNNKERSCLASAYTNWVAHAEGIGAVAKDLPNEADTHMISAYFFCPTILTQSACNGACEWSYATRSCIVRSTFGYGWIAAPMQKSSVARSDPVCRLFSYFANSGCEKLHTRFACQRNQYCLWGANNVCFVSPFRITAAVLSSLNDPSLSTSKVFPNCSGYRTAQQCASMVGPVSDPQFANHLALMNWQTSIAINTRARQSIHDFQADMFARGSSILL